MVPLVDDDRSEATAVGAVFVIRAIACDGARRLPAWANLLVALRWQIIDGLAWAELTIFVVAGLSTALVHRACRACIEIVRGTRRVDVGRQVDVLAFRWIRRVANGAAAEAVAARRCQVPTEVLALLRANASRVARRGAYVGFLLRGTASRIFETAIQNVAAIIAAAGVAVEETVLHATVAPVVSWDARGERGFRIVIDARALGIESVDQAIGIVVYAVVALCRSGNAFR